MRVPNRTLNHVSETISRRKKTLAWGTKARAPWPTDLLCSAWRTRLSLFITPRARPRLCMHAHGLRARNATKYYTLVSNTNNRQRVSRQTKSIALVPPPPRAHHRTFSKRRTTSPRSIGTGMRVG